DRPGPQQRQPVLLARSRPAGDHRQDLGSGRRRMPEQFGESQVVADAARRHRVAPGKTRARFARCVMVRFVGVGEQMQLRVTRRQQAIGAKHQGFVPWTHPFPFPQDDSTQQEDRVPPSQVAQEAGRGTVDRFRHLVG
ncbi:hypothetical protein RZS08_22830, partial [Arthrospira platensis SPKY1]|nr:hypothetical protein [Arthrospira platensis SPKY1]